MSVRKIKYCSSWVLLNFTIIYRNKNMYAFL